MPQPPQNVLPDSQPDPAVWGWFAKYPVLPFVLPLAVNMLLLGLLPGKPDAETGAEADNWFGLTYGHYPYAYAVALLLGLATLAACWRPIISQFPFRVTWLGPVVGLVGVVLWVAICRVDLEGRLVAAMGEENPLLGWLGLGPRMEFNPFEEFASQTTWVIWAFLVVRFIGLSLFVPLSEELMLRGWLLRHLETDGYRPHFWQVAFGTATTWTLVIGTAFPMLYHPEKLASLVWFSLVTWLMVRTKNFWDCVAAHAVTNFLLGVWVVVMKDWRLW